MNISLQLRDERSERGSVYYDITDRKRAEEALRESTRKLKATVNNLSAFVYRGANHPDWPVEYLSQGFFDLLGYPAEDFMSGKRTAASIIAPADRDRVGAEIQAAIKAKMSHEHFDR